MRRADASEMASFVEYLGGLNHRHLTIETSQGTVTIHTDEALGRNEVRAYSFDAAMLRLLDECNVCGNRLASTDGHRPGCSRDNRFDEADEWYAELLERTKDMAPA